MSKQQQNKYSNTSTERILIWNPILQKPIKLPLSKTNGDNSVLGFGFDSNKNDHRVVKISQVHDKDGSISTPLVEIYSVQEKTWRTISGDYLVHKCIHKLSSSNRFLNGAIHWVALKDNDTESIPYSLATWVLLFNVVEQTFGKMELPEALVGRGIPEYGVFEYQCRLCISLYEYGLTDKIRCQIWTKGEYNVGSSWRKILNVVLDDSIHIGPVEYIGKDEEFIVFVSETTMELVSYDFKTGQTNTIDWAKGSLSTKFSAYTESLVLLDQEIDALTHDELKKSADIRDSYFED